MRIYLIRHADPYYPDDSLTPTGHREAQALAEYLSEIGLDEIYASPRGRARLTASYTAQQLNLPVTIEPWTSELDGLKIPEYAQTVWDIDGAVLRGPEVVNNLNDWASVHPLDLPRIGIHLQNIIRGSDDFLTRQGFIREGHTTYRVEQDNRKRIAIFAHLGFGLTWLSHLLAIPLPLMWAGFFLHPSSVTTILMDERRSGAATPRVLSMGDISHLARAGLSPMPTGIIANYE